MMKNSLTTRRPESSSEKVNYLIRPAKQVERKLIIEMLQILSNRYPIKKYQYVGMGSLFYVDYQMVHKYLGIKSMISMEMEEEKIERYRFNKPYKFIKLIPGMSTDILPTLNWNENLFIWLDYDSKMSLSIINDIQIISNYIKPGGILIVTIDAEPKRFDNGGDMSKDMYKPKRLLNNFKKELYPYYPLKIHEKDFSHNRYPSLLYQMIVNIIQDKLIRRNLSCYQFINFKYKDTSQMYTFGCIYDMNPNDIKGCGLYDLEYVSTNSAIIEINVPIITPLEKIHFDKLIPEIAEKLTHFKMDQKKLNDYEKYYRYYPQYFESFL